MTKYGLHGARIDKADQRVRTSSAWSRVRLSHFWWALFVVAAIAALGQIPGLLPTANQADEGSSKTAPEIHIDFLRDPTRNLKLEDILEEEDQARFAPASSNSINFGYTRDAAWLRITVASSADRDILLSLTPNFVDLVDIYVGNPGLRMSAGNFTHIAAGDHRPVPEDSLSGLADVVPLKIAAGRTTVVYIRAASINSSLTLTASLYPSTDYPVRTTILNVAVGVWFGGMAVLLVIQLVFFHFDRKPYYALLAFGTFMAMLVYTGTLGISRLFLFPEGGSGNDVFTAVNSWFGLTASTLAAASILELPRTAPWINRIFLAGAAIGIVGVGFGFAGKNLVFADFAGATIIILAVLGAFQGLRTAGDVPGGRMRAAAFCILLLGLIATIAQRSGVGHLPNWVAQGYALSALIQTILLTGALAVRLRAAEALNRIMQDEALAVAREAEKRANRLVEERTRELATAKQVAEESLRAELASQEQQVRFMEVISHQYRTPLAAIRSYVDNIGLSLPRDDDANRRRLERVRRGIVRLVEVLEVNLSRSRMQGPSFQPELVRIPLAEIVKSAGARGRDLLQHPIAVNITPEAGRARVRADRDMLGIAIINLLENAVKFSAAIGEKSPVVLSCAIDDGRAVIAVTDRGIGIPAEEIEAILGRSVRGSNAASIDGSGTGLSLVSRIAAIHGGAVEIESDPGEGTVVRLALAIDSTRFD